jgi:diguanylate cyclase (GGDEF)-like protein
VRRQLLPGLIGAALTAAFAAALSWLVAPLLGLTLAVVAALTGGGFLAFRRRPAEVPAPPPPVVALTPSVVDADTGLPDNQVFELLLDARLAVARRRLWPVALVLVDIDPVSAAGPFALLLGRTIREADTACRIGPVSFAVILDDTDEVGGVWTADRIQIAVARERESEALSASLRVVAGVAAYPSHALTVDRLLVVAEAALGRARERPPGPARGLGAVEVARLDPL